MNRRSERGSSMVIALLTLFFTASMAALVLDRQDGLRHATAADSTELRARYAAEGGIARARWELAQNADWSGETFDCNGIRVTVVIADELVVATAKPGSVRITARR